MAFGNVTCLFSAWEREVLDQPVYILCFVHLPASIILRRLSGSSFKVLRFKFTIDNGRIWFKGKPMQILGSKNPIYPSSKGYYYFKFKGWNYFIHFYSIGMKIYAIHGKKIIQKFVRMKAMSRGTKQDFCYYQHLSPK